MTLLAMVPAMSVPVARATLYKLAVARDVQLHIEILDCDAIDTYVLHRA